MAAGGQESRRLPEAAHYAAASAAAAHTSANGPLVTAETDRKGKTTRAEYTLSVRTATLSGPEQQP